MKKPKVSIIIVHYKNKKALFDCLSSIKKTKTKISYEVIIIDNDEKKTIRVKLKKKFPRVNYVESPENIGYGAGNNLGAKYAKGKYLFYLNPDTEVQEKTIDSLVLFLEKSKKTAIAAPNLIDKSGKIFEQLGSRTLTPIRGMVVLSFLNRLFSNNPVSNRYFLRDVNKDKEYETDAVPGSAFMIIKEVFDEVGQFDENFFLYFEESDLCKRVGEAGYKMFFIPQASVVHHVGKSTPKTKKVKKIFNQSRFYYFRKHYGIIWATIVEIFAKLSCWHAALFVILAPSSFLRFWKLGELLHLSSDIGWYYLSARDLLIKGQLPLVGIPSSVPILRQGAIFTWLLAGALWIGNFNPIYGSYLTVIMGMVSVYAIFKITSGWFGKRIGIISSLLAASSPYIVEIDRSPFVVAAMFPATLLIAHSFGKIVRGEKKYYFSLGFWTSMLFQIELVGFILWPILVLTFFWGKLAEKLNDFVKFILGTLIGLTPFIVWDLKQGVYLQTLGFLGWVATKSLEGILGLFTGERGVFLFNPVVDYLKRIIFAPSTFISFILLSLAMLVFIPSFRKVSKETSAYLKLIFVWSVLGSVSFLIRGIYSGAYIPLLFFPLIVILSLFFDWVIKKKKKVGVGLLTLMILGNVYYLMKNFNKVKKITLSDRIRVADYIVKNSQDQDYELIYRGTGYVFPLGDSHWRYLLWWRGKEPKAKEEFKLAIFEYPHKPVGNFEIIKDFGYIKVGKGL